MVKDLDISANKLKVQYLALKVFSNTGGIEQVAKNWLFAFNNFDITFKAQVLYDNDYDERYIDKNKIAYFNNSKTKFIVDAIRFGIKADVLVISHIHLSTIAVVLKILNPKIKIHVQLHGIEAWNKFSYVQSLCLKLANSIFSVSNYTKNRVLDNYPEFKTKSHVIPNTLDPLKRYVINSEMRNNKRTILNLNATDKLMITVCRLDSSESYKGYDQVINAISKIDDTRLFYHIIGKYDKRERDRVIQIVDSLNLRSRVKIIGYVDDNELEHYYQAADLLIMPSKGEGFGLVFIEAMARGLRVIAGNKDGSYDAVNGFACSVLVDPDSTESIRYAINNTVFSLFDISKKEALSKECLNKFNSETLVWGVNKILTWK